MTQYIAAAPQAFSITLTATNATGTATINAAVGKQAIIWDGELTDVSTNFGESLVYLTISGTTITATRGIGTLGSVTVKGVVIDGTSSLITSVQTGTVSIAAASSGTAAIAAPNVSNAVLQYLGYSGTGTIFDATNAPILSYVTTTLTVTLQTTAVGTVVTAFQVLEYTAGALNSAVQAVQKAWTDSSASTTVTITGVTANNTILHYCGAQIQASRDFQYSQLTNGTTVTINAGAAISDAVKYYCYVAEFASDVWQTAVQRGTITMASVTNNTATVTGTNANANVNFLGFAQTSGSTANYNILENHITYSSPTVTATRNTATGTMVTAYEVWDWSTSGAGNTVTETVTETDSYTIIASDTATLSETSTVTDSYVAKIISAALLFTEAQTETDSLTILATGKGILTETQTETDSQTISASSSLTRSETVTESDNLTGARTASDGTIEIVTSTDTHAILATDNLPFEEDVAANDNYTANIIPSPSPAPAPSDAVLAGPSDGKRDAYLKWLKRKKLKQLRKRAQQQGLPLRIADKVADNAAIQVLEKLPDISPVTADYTIGEDAIRNVIQVAVLAIYEQVWEEEMKKRRREEEFFLMMM